MLSIRVPNEALNSALKLLEKIQESEGLMRNKDWYLLTAKKIREHEGTHFKNSILKRYFNDDVGMMVTTVKPELKLSRWLFKYKHTNFWENKNTVKAYLLWLVNELKLDNVQELSKISSTLIRDKYYGKRLIIKYNYNMYNLFTDIFPEYSWDILEFNYPLNFFKNKSNRIRFIKEIGNRAGYKKAEDFNKLSIKNFEASIAGRRIIGRIYKRAPSKAAKELYPNYSFKEWLFPRVPKNFWKSKKNHRKATDWLLKEICQFNSYEDFYLVREEDFEKNQLTSLLRIYGSSRNIVSKLYPDYKFEDYLFEKSGRGAMRVFSILKMMFPEYSLKWRYKFNDLRFEKSGYPIELDIFIPELKWGIEYQGDQHLSVPSHWGGEKATVELIKRDKEKSKLFRKAKIEVLDIWDNKWNGSPYELIHLLKGKTFNDKTDLLERLKKLEGKKYI